MRRLLICLAAVALCAAEDAAFTNPPDDDLPRDALGRPIPPVAAADQTGAVVAREQQAALRGRDQFDSLAQQLGELRTRQMAAEAEIEALRGRAKSALLLAAVPWILVVVAAAIWLLRGRRPAHEQAGPAGEETQSIWKAGASTRRVARTGAGAASEVADPFEQAAPQTAAVERKDPRKSTVTFANPEWSRQHRG
ncbi:MAG: hypothetical protein RL456_3543 [Pseudomonadota bacterium]|jgi:hypothetical protein